MLNVVGSVPAAWILTPGFPTVLTSETTVALPFLAYTIRRMMKYCPETRQPALFAG